MLDKTTMGNVLSTRIDEATAFFHLKLVVFVVFLGVLPSLLIGRTNIARSPPRKVLGFALAILVAGVACMHANAGT